MIISQFGKALFPSSLPAGSKIVLALSALRFLEHMLNSPSLFSAYLISHLFLLGNLPLVFIVDYQRPCDTYDEAEASVDKYLDPVYYLLDRPPGLSTIE